MFLLAKNHIFMKKLANKTVILLVGSVCVAVLLGIVGSMLYNFIKTESDSIKSAESAIAELESKEKDLANAKNSLETLKKDIDSIDQSFLSEGSFVAFLKLLETMAQRSGVTFQAESANLPRTLGSRAEINFSVRGDYSSLVKFFALFDQAPYAGIVDQISISPDSTKGSLLVARARYVIFNFLPR